MNIVLHICCGVCAAGAAERLISEGHRIIGYYYNPNIYPCDEYQKRLDFACQVARELNFPLEAGEYTPERWLNDTILLKDEPEGGKRCALCFRLRLEQAFCYMKDRGAEAFTTTLTIAPQKSAKLINDIGREIGGGSFLAMDFKKQDGFKRTIQLARNWNLYRQNYCGCVYSIRQGEKHENQNQI